MSLREVTLDAAFHQQSQITQQSRTTATKPVDATSLYNMKSISNTIFLRWLLIAVLPLIFANFSLAQVATPVFQPDAGDSITKFITVTVTCSTSGASIFYTTDGIDPTQSSTQLPVAGTILIGTNLTLKARAFKVGMADSAVKSATYRLTGALRAGANHVLAVKSNQAIFSWGAQASGRLGNNLTATANVATPPQVVKKTGPADITNAVDAAAGYSSSLVVDADGKLWAFGDNSAAQLGSNSSTNADAAVGQRVFKVATATGTENDYLSGVTAVAVARKHGLAVEGTAGNVWAWGDRSYGRLGASDNYVSTTLSLRKYAAPVVTSDAGNPQLTSSVQVACGDEFGLALTNVDAQGRGQLWSWGRNHAGQLGIGVANATNIGRAGRVKLNSTTNLSDIVDFAAGDASVVALRRDAAGVQTVWCWGLQTNGRLGNGFTTAANISYPIQVMKSAGVPLTNITQVSMGVSHCVALDSAGMVWAWGTNDDGQLGNGGTTQSAYAATVKTAAGVDLTNIVSIAAGGDQVNLNSYTLAIRDDGSIYGWGYNAHGETGNGVANATRVTYATASPFPLKLTNRPPTVTLSATSPYTYAPTSVALTATPSDLDSPSSGNAAASVAYVQFYRNGTLLGLGSRNGGTTWTWRYTDSNLPAGSYTYTAIAFDDAGASATSISQTVTILPQNASLTVSVSNTTEGSTTPAAFQVGRSSTQGNLTVNYTVWAGSTAVPNTDYTALSGSVSFNSADGLYKTINVLALADMLLEGDETVSIEISPSNDYTTSSGRKTITITDNPPAVFVAATNDAGEDGLNPILGTFTFSRTGLLQPLTATYTVSGTATAGSDFQALSGSVVFPLNVSTITVPVTPLIDALVEGDESVAVLATVNGVIYSAASMNINDARPYLVNNLDVDGDGLTNAQEYLLGTNPFSNDTDGDGALDAVDGIPLDPWYTGVPAPNDHTAPIITLTYPVNGVTPL